MIIDQIKNTNSEKEKDTIGFIPAAGFGKRMKPFLLLKELLPVKQADGNIGLLFESSFESFMKSGVNNVICTINESKDDLKNYIMRYCQKRSDLNVLFHYQAVSSQRYGIPYSISDTAPFLSGKTVIMRFPDTVLAPDDCIKKILGVHREKEADLTLGIFPTDNPQKLGPVLIGEDNRVLKIQDKPQTPCAYNTWNCLIWEDAFLNKVVEHVKKMHHHQKELLIYDVINECLNDGMGVYGVLMENGYCQDYSAVSDFIMNWADDVVEEYPMAILK